MSRRILSRAELLLGILLMPLVVVVLTVVWAVGYAFESSNDQEKD